MGISMSKKDWPHRAADIVGQQLPATLEVEYNRLRMRLETASYDNLRGNMPESAYGSAKRHVVDGFESIFKTWLTLAPQKADDIGEPQELARALADAIEASQAAKAEREGVFERDSERKGRFY